MFWSLNIHEIPPKTLRPAAEALRDRYLEGNPEADAPEVREQIEGAIRAAEQLVELVGGPDKVSVSMSGHASSDHALTPAAEPSELVSVVVENAVNAEDLDQAAADRAAAVADVAGVGR